MQRYEGKLNWVMLEGTAGVAEPPPVTPFAKPRPESAQSFNNYLK